MSIKENGSYQKHKQKSQKKSGTWMRRPKDPVETATHDTVSPSIGSQLYVHADPNELDIPGAFVWNQISSLAPFVKKSIPKNDRLKGNKFLIGSKNETEEETALKLDTWIRGKAVILSHSTTPLKNEQHCRAVVDLVKYSGKKIEVTVSADTGLSLWEDTDIWMFPVVSTSSEPPYSLEPNTSTAFEQTPEEPMKNAEELSQHDLFQSIHSWKYLSGTFQRMRRKCGDKWKNVYLTELRMTPVDPNKNVLLELVKENTMLRLSNDIDELGEVFVEVCRKTINESENTVTFGVAGFTRSDVDIPLSKETTYYISVDDGDDDEWGSFSSEDGILPGYNLEQNPDELCEKLGELKVLDVCIKTWFAAPNNIVFVRLVVASDSRKIGHFKKLHGHHVIIQSSRNENQMVLALISRVMKEQMILTLEAIPRSGKPYYFTKENTFTIQIDHTYETRLNQQPTKIEDISRQLRTPDSDIRFVRDWRRLEGQKRTFATFFCKNPAIKDIPIDTKVLLSKCWEFEGQVEKKADFVFAVRVEDEKAKDAEHTITFEIKFTKSLVQNSPEFQLSKAFYYIDFDSSDSISKDPYYTLIDARSSSAAHRETAARSCKIGEELKFSVFEYVPWKQMGTERSHTNEQFKVSRGSADNKSSEADTKNAQTQSRQQLQTPSLPSKPPRIAKPKRYQNRGYVYLSEKLMNGMGDSLLVIRVGFDETGNKIKRPSWNIGERLVLTEKLGLTEFKIAGNVYDTNGENVTITVDLTVSDLEFISKWNTTKRLLSFEEH